jgi:hypothetical protein
MSLLLIQGWSPAPGKTFHSDLGGSCKGPCFSLVRELPTQAAQWEMFPTLEIPAPCCSHFRLQFGEKRKDQLLAHAHFLYSQGY